MKKLLFVIIYFSIVCQINGQVYTDKVVGKKNEAYIDSLKVKSYPYSLPVWGAKATARGYDLPYSAGLSINYFGQRSDMIINDLFVGFNNGPMMNLDEIIRFNKAVASASAINFRPDIWVLPFLNVYGIFSKASTSTEIGAGIWIPDLDNVWQEIASFSSKANFDATSFGFGLTPTMGVGGGWMALDMNMNWTDVSALDKPVFTFIFGPRLGKSFKLKNPQSNLAVWFGGFRVKLSSSTNGSLNLSEVMPVDDLQGKVDNGFDKVESARIVTDEWWDGLTIVEKADPRNIAKYAVANRTLEAAGNLLYAVDGALNDGEDATVQYSLNKRPAEKWNFIVGSQYQINKHFMIRAEYGFLASRQQFMTGIQYRFGL